MATLFLFMKNCFSKAATMEARFEKIQRTFVFATPLVKRMNTVIWLGTEVFLITLCISVSEELGNRHN